MTLVNEEEVRGPQVINSNVPVSRDELIEMMEAMGDITLSMQRLLHKLEKISMRLERSNGN